jgi:hypothetical protein
VFKLPEVDSSDVNLPFCVTSAALLEDVKLLKSLLILELADSSDVNLSLALDVKVFKLLVDVCNVPITVLLLPVYVFNNDIEPVTPSIDVSLPFCTISAALFDEVKLLKSLLILELANSKEVNVDVADDVKLLKSNLILPLALSKEVNLPFCVVSAARLELVKLLKSLLIFPEAISS